MSSRRSSPQANFLYALIRSGYLPSEIPPIITTKYFSDYCKNNFKYLKKNRKSLLKKVTKYNTFTSPKPNYGRRNLALVHPLSQLNLSIVVTENRKNIKELIKKNNTSFYIFEEDINNNKAFKGLDFKGWKNRKNEIYSEYKYILKADISRFFYTAYTHSIPWAVIGKEKVKNYLCNNDRRLKKHWSSEIDNGLQLCQSRETFGIPVGPDLSRIIAEILMNGVENDKNFIEYANNKNIIRLVDDFLIGFNDKDSAENALTNLRKSLWDYNLQLNEDKTYITESKFLYRDEWELEFDLINVSNNIFYQEKEILHLIDKTLFLCEKYNTGAPAHWACRRLSKLNNFHNNFFIIIDGLLRLSRDYPSCTNHVAEFIINNKDICLSNDRHVEKIRSWIIYHLHQYFDQSKDFEISWVLFVSGSLNIKIRDIDINYYDVMPDPIIFTIFGLLRENHVLDIPLSKWKWRKELRKNGLYSEYWLPFYESVRRKWTSDQKLIQSVKYDPVFSKMLNNNVTFLDNEIFTAGRIDVVGRRYSKYKYHVFKQTKDDRYI
ncbi:RNA-directed DNA polymerase [Fodinicurvata sediminis]|uniref:RNA-directed DNA polymerase n=1 Tax=Fodinicurvata sediminis TaxID=1121832 RepID=UPI00040D12F6|nr:RNA-directed DNA polymerase [Fodinicurvata sediminis]